jgi:hypothetical protein
LLSIFSPGFQDENDPKVILTTAYVARNRARIRGALSGVTSPTSLSNVVARFGFDASSFLYSCDQEPILRRVA